MSVKTAWPSYRQSPETVQPIKALLQKEEKSNETDRLWVGEFDLSGMKK